MDTRVKLAWVLSLALLSGGVFAQGASPQPPAPPGSPAVPPAPRVPPGVEAELAAAQRELERAARQVAELSERVNRPYIQRFARTHGPFGRVIVGVQIDPHGGKDGARVIGVSPGGPAAEAGIRAGDLIVNVNGEDMAGPDAPHRVVKIMRDVKPDNKLVVRVLRDGDNSARVFSITPREGPDVIAFEGEIPEIPTPPRAFMVDGPLSNMEFATLTPGLGKYFGTDKGILVLRAPREGQLKLQDGDVILAIDGREPTSGSHAARILSSYQPGEKINIRIVRERKTVDVQTTI